MPLIPAKQFVVISGLPGSGKTTIGRALAPLLHLPLIDKDDILERLYETRGIGDAAWRKLLSRDADVILQRDTAASDGAVIVSFWRAPGMPDDSGTPTDWLTTLSGRIVHVHCECDAEIAARRFAGRTRHPGHLDASRSLDEIAGSIRALAHLPAIDIGVRVEVDTSRECDVPELARRISARWQTENGRPL